MELIDKLHNAGIGAIMDFVPVHFAVDAYGLKAFDGTALYEYPHRDVLRGEGQITNLVRRNARNGLVEITIHAYNQKGELVLSNVTEAVVKCRERD